LHEHLLRLCVDLGLDLAGPWYFHDLLGALQQLRSDFSKRVVTALADTEATRQINGALDFCLRRRRMVLIEGKAGIGKTEPRKLGAIASRAWQDMSKSLPLTTIDLSSQRSPKQSVLRAAHRTMVNKSNCASKKRFGQAD